MLVEIRDDWGNLLAGELLDGGTQRRVLLTEFHAPPFGRALVSA